MKNILKIAATLSLLSGAAIADPVFGIWKTKPNDNGDFGHVKIAACDDTICGTLVKSFDASGSSVESENLGKLIVWEMTNKGKGKYGGGKIWDPAKDKVYKSKMALNSDNELDVSGCILVICRASSWTRVE
jgi:uncharacterized protein (DUF2147 family)